MPGDFHFPPPTPQERYASAAAKYAGSGGASPTNPASANASAGTTAGGRSNLPDGTAANDGSPLPDAPHPDPAPLPPTAMDVGGRVIDLADPQQCLLEPAFLVPRLALVPRFQGQAHHPDGRFWSVAGHALPMPRYGGERYVRAYREAGEARNQSNLIGPKSPPPILEYRKP